MVTSELLIVCAKSCDERENEAPPETDQRKPPAENDTAVLYIVDFVSTLLVDISESNVNGNQLSSSSCLVNCPVPLASAAAGGIGSGAFLSSSEQQCCASIVPSP